MTYISASEKTAILKDLIELAKSDGMVSFSEMTYLIWVAQKLGVGQAELERMHSSIRSDFDQISPDQRLEQFHRLLHMMFVDTELRPEEVEKCKTLAYKMGLEPRKVDLLLAEVQENPKLMLGLAELKERYEHL